MIKNIESKSGLSKKERHLLQMGFEAEENGIKTQDEFYIYQNKTRKKITPTLTDTMLLLKYHNEHFDLTNQLLENKDLLLSIKEQIDILLDSNEETNLIKNDKA